MARRGNKKGAAGFVGGVVVTVVAMFGFSEFGIGGFGDGSVTVFSPQDSEVVVEQESQYSFSAIIQVQENTIVVDDEVVAIEDLKEKLSDFANEKVLLVDKNATHGAWIGVVEVLEDLNCIIQEQ